MQISYIKYISFKDAYIFEERVNPSTDYYILPALDKIGLSAVRMSLNTKQIELKENCIVFIVRYINKNLINLLKKERKKIKKIIYFMDDDLWDLNIIFSLPPKYAFKILKKAFSYKKDIINLDAELWVSTDYLQEKYKDYSPKVIYPYPLGLETPNLSSAKIPIVFYHGTSSHKKEIKWLSKIFYKLYQKRPELLFEIVLKEKDLKIFKNTANIITLRPMKWEVFYKFSLLNYRNIGLSPLYNKGFNKGRSWVKFYDITRSGAVGIYSEESSYAEIIKRFDAGIVLPMQENLWIEAIYSLANSEKLRKKLFSGALNLVNYLKIESQKTYLKAFEL